MAKYVVEYGKNGIKNEKTYTANSNFEAIRKFNEEHGTGYTIFQVREVKVTASSPTEKKKPDGRVVNRNLIKESTPSTSQNTNSISENNDDSNNSTNVNSNQDINEVNNAAVNSSNEKMVNDIVYNMKKASKGKKVYKVVTTEDPYSFQSVINSNTFGGWRYHSMKDVRVDKSGCGSNKPNVVTVYFLIFEKDE